MKKFWFWLSVGINLGFLGVFKYYNYFATSFAEGLSQLGIQSNFWTLRHQTTYNFSVFGENLQFADY